MSQDPLFTELMERLQAGEKEAADQIFGLFIDRLVGLARFQLDALIRHKVDAEDVVQSVFRSFFRRHSSGDIDINNWNNLLGFLVVITLRKCGKQNRRYRRVGRDVRRELSITVAADEEEVNVPVEAVARDPTPFEAAVLTETVQQLMQKLDERERAVLELRFQNYTVLEIGAQTGQTEHAVEGILKKIRKYMQQLCTEEENN